MTTSKNTTEPNMGGGDVLGTKAGRRASGKATKQRKAETAARAGIIRQLKARVQRGYSVACPLCGDSKKTILIDEPVPGIACDVCREITTDLLPLIMALLITVSSESLSFVTKERARTEVQEQVRDAFGRTRCQHCGIRVPANRTRPFICGNCYQAVQ